MAKKKSEGEASGDEKMSKAEAVRQAVANGHELPKDGIKYIKEQFGIDITSGTFSATKSQQNTRGKPKAAPRAPKPSSNGTHSSAELAMAVKKLVETYGADAVTDMAKVFA